ncbi:MAG TPA: alpha/beta hydrolase [Methanoregulaceae archaeon]|nr:alpha/beta hydrolase [Methanoregulaceae archaeon]
MRRLWKILGGAALALLLIFLIGPLVYPVPPLTGTLPERDLADPDSRFGEINNLTVHYKESGQGELVFILLHGFGASEFSWREVVEPLSNHGRVIVYDRPAFGLTSRPMAGEWTGTNPYSLQGNIELLNGLMDELGVEQAILVGNSAGGEVAAGFALEHPDRVQGLVLVDPAIGRGQRGGIPSWVFPLLKTPQLRRIGPLLVRGIAGDLGNETIRLAWHNPSLIDPRIYDGYRRPLYANNWDMALYEFTIAGNPVDYTGRLKELSVPVLVVTGDDDRIVPTESSIQLSKEIPGAELVILNACGHMPQEECPDQFMDALDGFLDIVR